MDNSRISTHRLRLRYGVLTVFFLFCFAVLCIRLFVLTVIKHEEYLQKAQDNIYSETPLKAERGIIYDRNMNVLAANVTTWRVYISPRDIKSEKEAELIARGMSDILKLDYETVLAGAKNSATRDRTLKKKATAEQKDKVIEYTLQNGLSHCLHTEAGSERYYPYGSLAAHVIGFMGTDSGLLGIEAYYDAYLKGEDGFYITSKNASGETLPDSYVGFTPATDGCSIITTLDVNIQAMLEAQLKATYIDSKAQNRVTGVALDPETGAVLAMATYPTFDLNDPYTLDEYSLSSLAASGVSEGDEGYRKAYNEALYKMWNNKAVSTLYEPGSTFKIVTTSVALELGISKTTEMFHCAGALKIDGYGSPIRCHKRQGHGSLNFAEALQKSCNPTMMNLAARIGNDRFMDYFIDFGYTGKTGIDLPGEALGIFHSREDFNTVELAVYSFGQTFKTTAIQQISAVSTVANGGNTMKPYVVSKISDSAGQTVYSHTAEIKANVLSEESCSTISEILEGGVSGDGGAKNAGVAGYKIAAKTGTSQVRDIRDENGNSYLYVGSCVAYAPSDSPEIAAIIVVDQPQSHIYYGSTVAAPYVSEFLKGALPYLGCEPSFSAEDEARLSVKVENYSDMSVTDAKKLIAKLGVAAQVIGGGDKIIMQVPSEGSLIRKENGKIILYTDGASAETVKVPNVTKLTATEAIKILVDLGFNISIAGVSDYGRGVGATVIAQSNIGETLASGSSVTLTLRYLDGKE